MTNIGWTKYQDCAYKGRLVGYQANRFHRMLLLNGKVEIFFNVTWINNVSPKPTPMELTVENQPNASILSLASKSS